VVAKVLTFFRARMLVASLFDATVDFPPLCRIILPSSDIVQSLPFGSLCPFAEGVGGFFPPVLLLFSRHRVYSSCFLINSLSALFPQAHKGQPSVGVDFSSGWKRKGAVCDDFRDAIAGRVTPLAPRKPFSFRLSLPVSLVVWFKRHLNIQAHPTLSRPFTLSSRFLSSSHYSPPSLAKPFFSRSRARRSFVSESSSQLVATYIGRTGFSILSRVLLAFLFPS